MIRRMAIARLELLGAARADLDALTTAQLLRLVAIADARTRSPAAA